MSMRKASGVEAQREITPEVKRSQPTVKVKCEAVLEFPDLCRVTLITNKQYGLDIKYKCFFAMRHSNATT
jgi:hypothetical protein